MYAAPINYEFHFIERKQIKFSLLYLTTAADGFNMLNWAQEYANHGIIADLVKNDKKWQMVMTYQTMNMMKKLNKIEKKLSRNSRRGYGK